MEIETADGSRGNDTFPPSWGPAPGTPYSGERRAWIASHIASAPVRRRSRTMSGAEALAKADYLAGKRDLERNAHLALFRAESLARNPEFAMQRVTHLALKR
jgi:hypothetical protein